MGDKSGSLIIIGIFLYAMIVFISFGLYFEIIVLDGRIKCNKTKGHYNVSDFKCCPNGKNIYDGKCQ